MGGRIALLAALPLFVACEDGEGPQGDASSFVVNVYVEVDDSTGMGASDLPVSANVTVASTFDDLVLTDSTGPDGSVTFADLPAGAYTVTHVATSQPAGSELLGSASQTVVAPFSGGEVLTRFVYGFQEGSIVGVAFRDDNGSGSFETGEDSVFPGVIVLAFAGPDTVGTAVAGDTTDAEGLYDLGELEAGDYTLLVRVLPGTAIVGGNVRDATVEPGEATFHELEFVGDPTGSVIDIEDARADDDGDTVKVRGERATTPWEEAVIEAIVVVELGTGTAPASATRPRA